MKKLATPKNLKELMELIKSATEEGAEVEFLNASTGEMVGPEKFLERLAAGKAKIAGIEEITHTGKDDCPACEPDISSPPTPELASKLLDIVAIHQHPVTYKPGQFLRYREHVHYVRNPRGLHCVVENISPPLQIELNEENEGSPIAYRKYDILIATSSRHGICVYPADSRELEIYPDADKLMGAKAS